MKRVAAASGTLAVALVLASTIAGAQTWKPPAESERCPSKWGASDERGSANHMTPALVLNAARLIRTGEVIEIGHVLRAGMPIQATRRLAIRGDVLPGRPFRRVTYCYQPLLLHRAREPQLVLG